MRGVPQTRSTSSRPLGKKASEAQKSIPTHQQSATKEASENLQNNRNGDLNAIRCLNPSFPLIWTIAAVGEAWVDRTTASR